MKKSQKSIFKENKNSFIITIAFVLVVLGISFGQNLFASPANNIYDGISNPVLNEDYATWGPNFGWVSFNSHDDQDDCVDGSSSCIDFGSSVDLVQGQPNFGKFTGQGWAGGNHLGWITFDPTVVGTFEGVDICGSGPQLGTVNGNDPIPVGGWARAIVAPTGPNDYWDGCISMSGVTDGGDPYGVEYDPVSGDITGSAWGGNLIGWLNIALHTQPLSAVVNPEVIFEANPSSINEGDSSVLSWSITGTTCSPLEPPSPDPQNGTNWMTASLSPTLTFDTGALSQNTTYSIYCTNGEYHNVTVVVGNLPFVDFYADPDTVSVEGETMLYWDASNVDSCQPYFNPGFNDDIDDQWQFAPQALSGSYQTVGFSNDIFGAGDTETTVTYGLDCTDFDGNTETSWADIVVTRKPIQLSAVPNAAELNPDGNYYTSLAWWSATDYSYDTNNNLNNCEVNRVQAINDGTPIGLPIATGQSVENLTQSFGPVMVPSDPTFYQMSCYSTIPGTSNPVLKRSNIIEVTYQTVSHSVNIDAPSCVQTAGDTTWLAYSTQVPDYSLCTISGPAPFNTSPAVPYPSYLFPEVLAGTYTLSCPNPVNGQPDIEDSVTIVNGSVNCPIPPDPPGTPNPDIIFEEF
ncbi:hypothetical protein GW765_01765 [Candidatus Parcubacteria bacterium]|nr:hypothetical protein [Candidatus Parcubacteria bacterium]